MRLELGSADLHSRTQREVLRDVMLDAAKRREWLTLRQLAKLTRFGEASISAQLRHLRKPEHGGFMVAKRQFLVRDGIPRAERRVIWEYRIARRLRRIRRSRSSAPEFGRNSDTRKSASRSAP